MVEHEGGIRPDRLDAARPARPRHRRHVRALGAPAPATASRTNVAAVACLAALHRLELRDDRLGSGARRRLGRIEPDASLSPRLRAAGGLADAGPAVWPVVLAAGSLRRRGCLHRRAARPRSRPLAVPDRVPALGAARLSECDRGALHDDGVADDRARVAPLAACSGARACHRSRRPATPC